MIEQINITNRALNNVFDGDSSRLKLSPASKGNIESKTLNLSSSVVAEKPNVKVYDNVGVVNRGASMEYVMISAEDVPVSAISEGARAVKTKKIDEMREKGGMKKNVSDNSYIADMKQSLESITSNEINNTTPSVSAENSNDDVEVNTTQDEAIPRMSSGRDITKKMNWFDDENKMESVDVNKVNVKDNNVLINSGLSVDSFSKDNINDKKQDGPIFGTGDSEVFSETPLKDDTVVSHKDKVDVVPKKVTNTNDLISSIPNPVETHEKDQLADVHDKLFGVKHEEDKNITLEKFANADIDNMSIEDLKHLMDGVKRINEDTKHAEDENNRLERENGTYLEETRNLTSEVSEAKRRFIEEVNRQKESSLKAQAEANERHGKLVSEREELESEKSNAKAQLDEINKIRDEFIGSYSDSSTVRSR